MTCRLLTLSSVTRWLLVVAGCAVLETAQPAKAAEAADATAAAPVAAEAAAPAEATTAAPTARTAETLLIPGGSRAADAPIAPRESGGTTGWLVVFGLCAGGTAWFWWRKRMGSPLARGQRDRQIQIEESRPLGNRQYLVVATVGEKKFLLGVTPGSIQMLAPLESQSEAAHVPVA